MATEKNEKLWVCTACGEEYTGKTRKWTCPMCGNADTYVEETFGKEESYDFLDEDEY